MDSANLSINRVSKGVNDTTKKTLAHWHIDNVTRARHSITLLDEAIIAENDDTDIIRLKIKRHPLQEMNKAIDRDA